MYRRNIFPSSFHQNFIDFRQLHIDGGLETDEFLIFKIPLADVGIFVLKMLPHFAHFPFQPVEIGNKPLDEKAENAIGYDADVIDDFILRYKTTPFLKVNVCFGLSRLNDNAFQRNKKTKYFLETFRSLPIINSFSQSGFSDLPHRLKALDFSPFLQFNQYRALIFIQKIHNLSIDFSGNKLYNILK